MCQICAHIRSVEPDWCPRPIVPPRPESGFPASSSSCAHAPDRCEVAQKMQELNMNFTPGNISLRGLRTFCVAAQDLSFREAAEKLFITASAVSHQIKNLELQLGQPLFDRQGSALALTAAGESLQAEMSPLIRSLDEVADRHRVTATRSVLRVSVQPFFASELFVPRLAEFAATQPEIVIKVDTSDQSTEKHPANADASIRVFSNKPRNRPSDFLFPLNLVPAAAPEFAKKMRMRGKNVIGAFPLIVHERRPQAWTQWQKSAGISLANATTAVRLDSMIAIVRAAQKGLGVALVPPRLTGTMFKSGTLMPLFEQELKTSDAFYFVSGNAEPNDNVQLLRDWVVTTFRDTG